MMAIYPKRTKQHVSESDSAVLLRRQMPKNWLIREMSDRDYGIDALIEIVANGRMTGNMIVAQVKSHERFPISGEKRNFYGMKWSTFNYLVGNPAPAFLFVCSLKDEMIYWRSLKEVHRDLSGQTTKKPTIPILKNYDLSAPGQITLQLSVVIERRWADVERAAIACLMFFNAFGPLCLACKRQPREMPLPSSVQLLIIQHYEYNQILQRYLLRSSKRYPDLIDVLRAAATKGEIGEKLTFTAGFATEFLHSFAWDYIEAVNVSDSLIRRDQRSYWLKRYPYAIMQIDAFPPYFVDEDWFSRYYFDEYENETGHIDLDIFTDIDTNTRHSFREFMVHAPKPGRSQSKK